MAEIHANSAPVTTPVEHDPATTETWLNEMPSGQPAVPPGLPPAPPEPEEPVGRRRFGRLVAAMAGLIIVIAIGILAWFLWPDPAPQAPESLRIETTEARSVELRWDAASGGPEADSYVILRGEDEVGSVDAPATSYVVAALTPNTRYQFAVVAVDGDRRSEPSETVAVTTDPDVPSSLGIEDRGATSAQLAWDAPAGPAVDSYVILSEGEELAVVPHPETSFLVEDLIPGATYEFAVVAQDGSRRSLPATATVTTIAPSPGEVTSDPAANTIDTIALTWSPPAGVGAPDEYIVYRWGETVANVPGDTLTYTDTGLAPATGYEYSVAASWGFRAL
jgi:chitodextrinase